MSVVSLISGFINFHYILYNLCIKQFFFSVFKIEVIVWQMWYTDMTHKGLCILWYELLLIIVALSHI